ncbi:MAG: polyprenyl synthetase family protein [Anaerolineae bacterium]
MTRQDVYARLLDAVTAGCLPEQGNAIPSSENGLVHLAREAWQRAITRDFPVLLTVWAADAVGSSSGVVLDAAAAWSGLYLAAKLLDDLQDGDPGILGGDASPATVLNLATGLVFAAHGCLTGDADSDSSSIRLRLAGEFSRYSLQVAEGQELGLQTPPEGEAVLAWAWDVLRKKGALPFALACRAGAIAGEAPESAVEVMTELGRCIGEAVQLMDDALGLRARDVADIRSVAIPLAYGLSVADDEDSRSLTDLAGAVHAGNLEAVEPLCLLLERMGAMRYLSIGAAASIARARSLLSSPSVRVPSAGAQALAGVVDWLDPASSHPSGT